MAGYREHRFDPNATWGEQGPPLRPFNWVQWTSVGFMVFGGVAFMAYVLGRAGAIPKVIDDGMPFASFMPIGAALINARRQPAACNPEALKRRRILLIAIALGALVLGAAIAIFVNTQGA